MASTALGAQLTELQYRQQVALRAGVSQDVIKLWPAVDTSSVGSVTDTWPPFEEAVKTLIQARYDNSSGIAARYFEMFRSAEGDD